MAARAEWWCRSRRYSRDEAFLAANGVDMQGIGEPWLMVAIRDPRSLES
ncbi:hypothetical protein ACR80S_02730 [Halomonas sp. MA07-2]